MNSYLPIVNKNKKLNYSAKQKKWQEVRRGRYVEFNLLHDKELSLESKPMEGLKYFYEFTPTLGGSIILNLKKTVQKVSLLVF